MVNIQKLWLILTRELPLLEKQIKKIKEKVD
jgi:hypothetical protein